MSVEDTLAERGARYGDFTDHAAVCQRIKMAMIAGAARWTRLPDTHKQALEVIADKIARILTGDPNYADNWHDIQGYAKLVEDRLPKTPDVYQQGEMIVVHTPEQRAAIYAALVAASDPEGGKISIHFGTQPKCAECLYPADAAGTHYATCSQLTAPEEYKAEAQVAFDEAAEISEALARQVSAGTLGESYCLHCGAAEGAFHRPDCTIMRRGKSRLSKTPAHAGLDSTTPGHTIRPPEEVLAEVSEAWRRAAEPAAAMDDDSPRMQAIGQNGNDGEHYDDPFAGAPNWVEYAAQDSDGRWYWYEFPPEVSEFRGLWRRCTGIAKVARKDEPSPNWRDTLITRT